MPSFWGIAHHNVQICHLGRLKNGREGGSHWAFMATNSKITTLSSLICFVEIANKFYLRVVEILKFGVRTEINFIDTKSVYFELAVV